MRTIKILLLCQSSEQAAMPSFCLRRNNTIRNFNAHFSLQRASCLMLLSTPGSPPPSKLHYWLTYVNKAACHASCSFKIRNMRHEFFLPTWTEYQNQNKKESFFSYMYISCRWAPNARRMHSYINVTHKRAHPWSSYIWREQAWTYWIQINISILTT